MSDIASISSDELKNRRKELQSRRRLKALQSFWRFAIVAGMTGGLFWLMTLPNWMIHKKAPVEIEGNQWLSQAQIRTLISLSSPQSIWEMPTEPLIEHLKKAAPIADAQVSRQLFPPKLTIGIKERQPVAIALVPKNAQILAVGFLDEEGVLIPKHFYTQIPKGLQLPTLKVTGLTDQQRPYWRNLYQSIINSPVQIFEVDWRNPANLILKTELGTVYCGAYPWQFSEKLAILAKMRALSSRVPSSQIAYIDLTNPKSPTIQLKQSKPKTIKPST